MDDFTESKQSMPSAFHECSTDYSHVDVYVTKMFSPYIQRDLQFILFSILL